MSMARATPPGVKYATPEQIAAFAADRGKLEAIEWRDADGKLVAHELAVYCVLSKGRLIRHQVIIPANDTASILDAAR